MLPCLLLILSPQSLFYRFGAVSECSAAVGIIEVSLAAALSRNTIPWDPQVSETKSYCSIWKKNIIPMIYP